MIRVQIIIIVSAFIVLSSAFLIINPSSYVVLEIDNTNLSDIVDFAAQNGYRLKKKVTGFHNIFIFEALSSDGLSPKRSHPRATPEVFRIDKRVNWFEHPQELRRSKRNVIQILPEELDEYRNIARERDNLFNDELWDQEWYLQDTRSKLGGLPKLDLNVLPVYYRGITGKGVRVSVLDDGLEYTHEDIYPNYDEEISWNCNQDIPDPRPMYPNKYNSHGTRCAGEIAMVANNGKCGVGVAFGARIGGIRLLGGKVYDLIEGMALGFAYDKIDIYSSSWGPTDDGASLEGPGYLAKKAILRGIKYGRNGKGVIYVWASGNGGSHGDNCNCDGYTSSIYTIAVGSASQRGTMPWYGEMCSATLTVTYSSGAYEDQMVATTDVGNSCTVRHTGTSASAPLAAGIIALGLEQNPNLTWRDVQHIVVNTAEYAPVRRNIGWIKNDAGFYYNTRFGFGLMNADAFVTLAANWTNVGPQLSHTADTVTELPISIDPSQSTLLIHFLINDTSINYLEHVAVTITMEYTNRGALEFYLTSPRGTSVQLLGIRYKDKSIQGFKNWELSSVATWGEDPSGLWIMTIRDNESHLTNDNGIVSDVQLKLYGTKEQPEYLKGGPRRYNMNYE